MQCSTSTSGGVAAKRSRFGLPVQHRCGHLRVAQVEAPTTSAPGVDMSKSGLRWLSEAARKRATEKKASKFEKVKVEKCGSEMWTEVYQLAKLVREGKTKWEDLDLDDVDMRLKWVGLFHRSKRTPGKFMMRLRLPNGELDSRQLSCMADIVKPLGTDGCFDITTRANIQMRGLTLDNADNVLNALASVGITTVQSGLDNVRNLTGNPIAGVDPHELVDTRPICKALQDVITNHGRGRADLCNLPRKINFAVSSTRDDFPHCHINDVAFEAVKEPKSGEVVFNLWLGGMFSLKRNTVSIKSGISLTQEQLVPFSEALLQVFRDHGARGADRQSTRLIYLVESLGLPKFLDLISQQMGGAAFAPWVEHTHKDVWERRDLLGVHRQKQEGMYYVGACVPAGRMQAGDVHEMARIADEYGDGTVRLTCDENVVFVNVPEAKLDAMLAEPLFQRFQVNAGLLTRAVVSCTGSQFCGFALAETKNKAISVCEKLEKELELPRMIRVHFTGCPNSCGQAQVGDIGLMGAPAKVNGKAVEGFKIMLGGKIGEQPALAKDFQQGVPADEAHLLPALREILIREFGAKPKVAAA